MFVNVYINSLTIVVMENETDNNQDSQHQINQVFSGLVWINNHRKTALTFLLLFLSITSVVKFDEIPIQDEYRFLVPYIPTFQKLFQQLFPWKKNETIIYEPKDVRAQFNYTPTGEASLTDLNLTFVNLDQRIHCKLWEGIDKTALLKVIERFGYENNFTENQIEQMKSGTEATFHANSVETFQHGMQGLFTYVRYAIHRNEDKSTHDFMISYYGYTWNFNTLTSEDILTSKNLVNDIKANQDIHSGIDLSMIPQQGYETAAQQVKDLHRISSKNTITFEDTENMLDVFRKVSDKALDRQCSKHLTTT